MKKITLWKLPVAENIHFDIDKYLNRVIPRSPLYRLPGWFSRFLGYRQKPAPDVGNILVAIWSFLGALYGLILVGAVLRYSPSIRSLEPPVLFASLV
jgi:hypothetical protein